MKTGKWLPVWGVSWRNSWLRRGTGNPVRGIAAPAAGAAPHFSFAKEKRAAAGPKRPLVSPLDTCVKWGDAALLALLWKTAGASVGAGMVLLKLSMLRHATRKVRASGEKIDLTLFYHPLPLLYRAGVRWGAAIGRLFPNVFTRRAAAEREAGQFIDFPGFPQRLYLRERTCSSILFSAPGRRLLGLEGLSTTPHVCPKRSFGTKSGFFFHRARRTMGAPCGPCRMGRGDARARAQFSPQAETEYSGLCGDDAKTKKSGGCKAYRRSSSFFKNSTPLGKMNVSLKSKSWAWSSAVAPVPRKKNTPGTFCW